MKRFLILFALAACGTPQERCINGVSGDLGTLDRLIAETQGNISRGFGYETQTQMVPEWVDCTPGATPDNPKPKSQMCFDDVPQQVRRPVALDLAAEQAKLDSMVKRRGQMASLVAPAIEDCKARYPE
jgi:hypothetical protein